MMIRTGRRRFPILLATIAALALAMTLLFSLVRAQEGSAPDKPRGLDATATHDQVVLTWDDPDDDTITGYVILRRVRVNDTGGDFSVLAQDTGTAATTYTDGTVAASTTYTYRIKAINGAGTSERSRWFHIDIPAAPEPPEPVNSPATGAPAISGTVQVGEELTAGTPGIADEDGLENATFGYQWLAEGSDIPGATARTYTLSNSDEGKAIRVRVSFTDDAGNEEELTSAATDAVAAAGPSEPPTKPTGLSATATHDQVTLTWEDPSDDSITGYVILRRIRVNDVGGEFSVLVPDTGSAATTYTDDTVAASTTYTYRIKAVNGAGTSERSRWYHIDTPAAPEPETDPADLAPASLAAELVDGQVVLHWDPPAEDAGSVTGYEILRGEGEDEPATLAADTGSAAATYTDATANTASTSYAYSVKAIRDGERSQASNEAAVQLPPAVPAGVNSAAAHDRVLLSWNDPQDGAITGYRILRADVVDGAPGEFATMIADTGSAATTYTDTTVEPEGSYVYRVQAIGPGGLSGPSPDLAVNTPPAPVVVAVTPADPQAPTDLSAELTDGQVALHWDAPTQDANEVTGYEILRAEGQGELATLESDTGNAATTYTDATVASAGASYAYLVKAIRDGERSGASNEARALLKPAKPTGLTATAAHDAITLTWEDPGNDSITGYMILRRIPGTDPEGHFDELVADTGSAATTYTDNGVSAETRYTYRIKAINGAGVSDRSRWYHINTPAAPDGQPPAAPQQVLSGAGHDIVLLHWADPQDDSITGYRILRADIVDGAPGEFAVLIEDTGTDATTYTDDTVEPEASYVYRVMAINPGGVGEPSSDVEVRTTAPVGPQEPLRTEPANVSEGGTDCPHDTTTTCQVDVGGSATGNIGTAIDEDNFKVELEAGTRYQMDLEGAPTGRGTLPDPLLEIRSPTNLPLSVDDDGGVGANSRVIYTPTSSGTHYLRARKASTPTGTYTLSVIVLGANGVSEADTDFPTTTATTGRVEVGASATGNIDRIFDQDWFRVDLEAGKTYQIDMKGEGGGGGTLDDPRLFDIRDSDGTAISGTANDDADADNDNYDSQIIYTPTTAGTYYLVADHKGNGTGTYTLSVREVMPPDDSANVSEGGTDCPSNTATTCEVDIGGSATGTLDPGDRDWFKLELEAGTRYQIDVEGADTNRGTLPNPDTVVLDAMGANLIVNQLSVGDTNSGVGENSRTIYTPEEGGTYFVQVRDPSSSTGTYTVSVIVLGANGNSEADTDFPATIATSGRVDVGASATGTFVGIERDHFRVDLEAGTRYQIDVEGADTGRGTAADPRVVLHDASNTQLGANDNSGVGKNARMIYTPTAAGTYYVHVAGGPGTYTLSVREVTPPDDSANVSEGDGDLHAGTTTTGRVQVGGSVTGNIDSEDDKDWFKVVLEAGKTYQFDMEGVDTERGTLTNPWLFLRNEPGTLIITYNDDRYNGNIRLSRNSRIIHTATAAGAHYLEARGSIRKMGTYTLSAREITPADDPDQPPVDPNRPQVTLHLSDDRVNEDYSRVTVTATVSPASPVPFTVEVSATPASPDGDFGDFEGPAQEDDFTLSTNRTLSFAANATASTGTVTISTIADSPANPDEPEPHELVTVSGVVSDEGIRNPDDITLTILNDDPERFDIWVSVPATVDEDAGTATVTYKLRTRGVNQPPVVGSDQVYYILEREGTAARNDDYTTPPGMAVGRNVIFDAVPVSAFSPSDTRAVWEAERTFTIGIVDDADEEGNETIVFHLIPGGLSTYRSINRTITILDDDTTPTVTIRAVNRDTIEGVPARFRLTRTGSRQESLIVRVMITEEDDRDLLASGVQTEHFISIRRGEAKATFTLDVRDNISGSNDGDITAEIG